MTKSAKEISLESLLRWRNWLVGDIERCADGYFAGTSAEMSSVLSTRADYASCKTAVARVAGVSYTEVDGWSPVDGVDAMTPDLSLSPAHPDEAESLINDAAVALKRAEDRWREVRKSEVGKGTLSGKPTTQYLDWHSRAVDAIEEVERLSVEYVSQLLRAHLPTRPRGWITQIVERLHLVGALPAGNASPIMTQEERVRADAPWWLATLTALLTYCLVLPSILLVPVLGTSPVTAIAGRETGSYVVSGITVLVIAIILGVVLITLVQGKGFTLYRGLCNAALSEEITFRLGQEKWSRHQRVSAAVSFGVLHLINLIYTIATCLALVIVGMAFGAWYRRLLRLTSDHRYAITSAAKLHARSNLIILTVATVLVLGLLVVFAISLAA